MKKEQLIELRKKVQMYAMKGMRKSVIARTLGVSRKFVAKWYDAKEVESDNRGWKQGQKRKFTDEQEKLVIQKRKELEQQFFLEQ